MEEDPTTASGVAQDKGSLIYEGMRFQEDGVTGEQGGTVLSPPMTAPRFGSGAVDGGLPGEEPVEEKLGDLLARLVSPKTLRFRSGFSKGPEGLVVKDETLGHDVVAGTSRQSEEKTGLVESSKISLTTPQPAHGRGKDRWFIPASNLPGVFERLFWGP